MGTSILKPVLVITSDGGQDENPRFYGQVMSCTIMLLKLGLEHLILTTRAAGFSAMNAVEVSQSYITQLLAGSRIASDHYGSVRRRQDGEPRTEDDQLLEIKNHQHACERVTQLLGGANNATAWGYSMTGAQAVQEDDLPTRCKIQEQAILNHKVASGGCKCSLQLAGDELHRCKGNACNSCRANALPCTFRCDCRGQCDNTNATAGYHMHSSNEEEVQGLSFRELVDMMTPIDFESFATTHCIILQYSLQVKLCTSPDCVLCAQFSKENRRIADLDFYPVNSIADGRGGWVSLADRHKLLRGQAVVGWTSNQMSKETAGHVMEAAREVFLTDKYLPGNVVKNAWPHNKDMSDLRARLLSSSTNLGVNTIFKLFEAMSSAANANLVARNQRKETHMASSSSKQSVASLQNATRLASWNVCHPNQGAWDCHCDAGESCSEKNAKWCPTCNKVKARLCTVKVCRNIRAASISNIQAHDSDVDDDSNANRCEPLVGGNASDDDDFDMLSFFNIIV